MTSEREQLLERKLAREKAARKQAESILEAKALELFQTNEQLKALNTKLEEEIVDRTNEARKSDTRFRQLVESAKDLIYNIDYNGIVTYANRVTTTRYGYGMDDVLGQPFTNFIHPDYLEEVVTFYLHKRDDDNPESYFEFPVLTKAGEPVWIGQNARRLEFDGEVSFIVIARDISERKKTEEALLRASQAIEKSEAKYRGILENMDLGLLEVDPEDRILHAYPKFCELSGYSEDELIGKKATQLLLPPEYHDVLNSQNSSRKQGMASVYEVELIRRDGTRRWVIISGAPFTNQEGEITGSLGIHFDITERKELQAELIEAKEAAERAQESEREFLASMSHEIRTPLNAIIGMSHLLEETDLNMEQRQYTDILKNSGNILHGLISDILDFSKIDAGKIEVRNSPIDLARLAETLGDMFRIKSIEKDLDILLDIDEALDTQLLADKQLLNQVLINLMGNAEKFTESGTILLKIEQLEKLADSRKILFEVQDTGVGMTPEEVAHIFDQFTQASKEVRIKYGGTGLGLSISRKLVELLGGEIQVTSEKGKGSRFYFTLELEDSRTPLKQYDAQSKEADFDGSAFKILVAEDNSFNQHYITRLLTQWNFHFDLANDGVEATEMASTSKYDLVFMDLSMPRMTGYEAAKWIRTNDNLNRETIIVALTASTLTSMREEAMKMGMNDFMSKPFTPNELKLMLSKYLDTHIQAPTIERPPDSPETSTEILRLDTAYIDMMYGDDSEYKQEIFEMFMTLAPADMKILEEHLDSGNHEDIYKQAHKLKPMFAMVGLPSITEQMKDLEQAGRSKTDLLVLRDMFQQIEIKLKASWPLLEDYLQTLTV